MSLASQVSALATAVGAKIKAAAPITKHDIAIFGLIPTASSAPQNILTGAYYFGTVTYGNDANAGTTAGSTSTWSLSGHWSGTYSMTLYYAKLTNTGIMKLELSKDGGATWTTLNAAIDLYAAAATGAVLVITGIAIPEGSDVQLRVTITGKNAAASAYYYTISGWELTRTGP